MRNVSLVCDKVCFLSNPPFFRGRVGSPGLRGGPLPGLVKTQDHTAQLHTKKCMSHGARKLPSGLQLIIASTHIKRSSRLDINSYPIKMLTWPIDLRSKLLLVRSLFVVQLCHWPLRCLVNTLPRLARPLRA